jgi:hypothetical protein
VLAALALNVPHILSAAAASKVRTSTADFIIPLSSDHSKMKNISSWNTLVNDMPV